MCGILGWIDGSRDEATKALGKIAHRGKDHQAQRWLHHDRLYFGHTRLAIQDLSAASDQPMVDEEGRYALIYNGEIYNFKELGEEILGRAFASDTRFLFALLRHYADDREGLFAQMVRFRGFWAFGFYDAARGTVLLVRDLFGKKPLYYSDVEGSFRFASEIAAILPLLRSAPTLRREMLPEVLKYRFSLHESPYTQIQMLERGGWLSYDLERKNYTKGCYFDPFDLIRDATPRRRKKEAELLEWVTHELEEAVKLRLVSDVPVGTITSGGLDSSLVSAIANAYRPTSLFHVDVRYDSETPYAKALAEALGVPLHIVPFGREAFFETLERTREHYEYPLAHPNNVGLYHLAQLAEREGYKVLLSGEGADESFGGYDKSASMQLYLTLRRFLPTHKLHRLVVPLQKLLGSSWMLFMEEHNRNREVLEVEFAMERDFGRYFDYYHETFDASDALYQAFLAVQFLYYTRPLLLRADKIFMASSVELRSPFFDPKLVRCAMLLPPKLRKGKRILKKIAASRMPASIVKRKKMGFPIPPEYYSGLRTPQPLLSAEQNFILDSFERLHR